MSRTSASQFKNGLLWNGYDYDKQAWVLKGIYQDCGHPETMHPDCCNAHQIAGQAVKMEVA